MAFKDRLKEARLSNNMTQEQIAERIGVAKSTFTGYEKGNSEPNMLTISKIMSVLNVDANYLWQDEMDALGVNPMTLKYDEMKHIEKYRLLDDHGRDMVDTVLQKEYDRSIDSKNGTVVPFQSKEKIIPVAAHERTDIEVTDEMRQHDDDIMNDPDF